MHYALPVLFFAILRWASGCVFWACFFMRVSPEADAAHTVILENFSEPYCYVVRYEWHAVFALANKIVFDVPAAKKFPVFLLCAL